VARGVGVEVRADTDATISWCKFSDPTPRSPPACDDPGPRGLRLTQTPVADCARYDSLRKAS
jgi:hypothetical protein